MARLLHKRNCGSSLVSILFKSNVCLHELTPALAELLPKMDRWSWKFDYDLPRIVEPDRYASYSPLTAYILRKIFGDSGLFKARTFKNMCDILDSTFPAVGDVPETPYISRATIAYVHSLILHTPYYSRDDKNIKGKVEDYYRRELDILEEITDQDFKEGVHAMFKHHYNWMSATRRGVQPRRGHVRRPSFSDAARLTVCLTVCFGISECLAAACQQQGTALRGDIHFPRSGRRSRSGSGRRRLSLRGRG